MAYEEHTWETGETITAEKLNHMEEGITNSADTFAIQVQVESDVISLSKTWKEISDALKGGKYAYIIAPDSETNMGVLAISSIGLDDGSYYVQTSSLTFSTDSATGYPTVGGGGGQE